MHDPASQVSKLQAQLIDALQLRRFALSRNIVKGVQKEEREIARLRSEILALDPKAETFPAWFAPESEHLK